MIYLKITAHTSIAKKLLSHGQSLQRYTDDNILYTSWLDWFSYFMLNIFSICNWTFEEWM